MGHQIIRQPDGKLAVFSSYVDAWILVDAEPADLLGYYAEKAAEDARDGTQRVLDLVLDGQPRKAYYQFAMTFEEANEDSAGHGGPVWRDGEWTGLEEPAEKTAGCWLNVEWGETPFAGGDDGWPVPLIRPEPHDGSDVLGEPVQVPVRLLERWRRVEAELKACQAELAEIAGAAGELQ